MNMKAIQREMLSQFKVDFDKLITSGKTDPTDYFKKYLKRGISFALCELKNIASSDEKYKDVVCYVKKLEEGKPWYNEKIEADRLMAEDVDFHTFLKSLSKEGAELAKKRLDCILTKSIARGVNIVFHALRNSFSRNEAIADIIELAEEQLKHSEDIKIIFERGLCGLSESAYEATK